MLGFKETLFLFGVGLSVFIFLYDKKKRYWAIITFIISIIWGYLSIKVIIPHFSGVGYYYGNVAASTFSYATLLSDLIYPTIKIKTVFLSYASFLFLPLLYPPLIPTVMINFASRFIVNGSTRWDLGLHYNAEIAPTLAVGAIFGLNFLKYRIPKLIYMVIISLAFLVSIWFYRFYFHGPMGLAVNPAFYAHTKDFKFLREVVEVVPKNSSVSAQNNIASMFLHNKEVSILRDDYWRNNPEYIVLDRREGQNPLTCPV